MNSKLLVLCLGVILFIAYGCTLQRDSSEGEVTCWNLSENESRVI